MPSARAEDARVIQHGDIGAVYSAIGSPTTKPARMILVTNLTDAHLWVTWDNSLDAFPVAAGNGIVLDFTANMETHGEDKFCLPVGTQFYAKQINAPTQNFLSVSLFY